MYKYLVVVVPSANRSPRSTESGEGSLMSSSHYDRNNQLPG